MPAKARYRKWRYLYAAYSIKYSSPHQATRYHRLVAGRELVIKSTVVRAFSSAGARAASGQPTAGGRLPTRGVALGLAAAVVAYSSVEFCCYLGKYLCVSYL